MGASFDVRAFFLNPWEDDMLDSTIQERLRESSTDETDVWHPNNDYTKYPTIKKPERETTYKWYRKYEKDEMKYYTDGKDIYKPPYLFALHTFLPHPERDDYNVDIDTDT